jgi:hypothetical protein
MPGPRLEGAINAMAARARLYERMAHDRGPWGAVVHAREAYTGAPHEQMYPMVLNRHVCGDRVVLSGYLAAPVTGLRAVDIWCRGELMVSWPVSQPGAGPVRICLDISVEDAELAA